MPYYPLMNPPAEAALDHPLSGAPAEDHRSLERYLADARAWLTARCSDADLAEELAQEVASRLALRRIRLDRAGNPRSYVLRMAHNAWRDWLRHELVHRRQESRIAAHATLPASADQQALETEMRDGLRRAIDALPEAEREVVELRHRGDLTFEQIARRLGRPLGTVLGQMRSALKRMQEMMEAYR